jgi:regulator of sigma E protease
VRVAPTKISERIRASQGAPIRLTVLRDDRQVTLPPARPRKEGGEDPGTAIVSSLKLTGTVSKAIGTSLVNLVHEKNRKDISSAVGTVQASSDAVKRGWRDYLSILGLISLSLALLNLLPLLPLDGGHIAFSIIEGVRRRAVAREVYERVSAIGIALVLLLFFIGLSNDVGRFGGG